LAGKTKIWLRIPLVPGFNDDLNMADKIVELGRQVKAEKVYFLPLHRWGEHKYCSLGHDGSAFAKIRDFTEEELEKWKDHYKSFSDYVILVKHSIIKNIGDMKYYCEKFIIVLWFQA